MNGTLKSKQGCWTCRLRRKKCDERPHTCSTCESLTIPCYGYGSKPDWVRPLPEFKSYSIVWTERLETVSEAVDGKGVLEQPSDFLITVMDNGAREKEMANNIKQIVKKTSRQKGRLGISMSGFKGRSVAVSDSDPGGVKIAPKPMDVNFSSARVVTKGLTPPLTDTNSGSSPRSSDSAESPHNQPEALSWLSAVKSEEAVLLMHFIDIIFPLQYPMYRPSIIEGGRGWLLSLLLRTKPLYHASLALSAYHRGTALLASHHGACSAFSTVSQEQLLSLCLSEFRQAIRDAGAWIGEAAACPSNSLGLMACAIQLIFFELFAGNREAWRIHLRATTDSFVRGYWHHSMDLGLVDSPDVLVDGKTTLVLHAGRSVPEDAGTFFFLSGVTIWLDVLSTITTGSSPRLLPYHPHAVSLDSAIKLENIMGCKNPVIQQIGLISALYEYKSQALEDGCLDIAEFDARAGKLRHELHFALAEYSLSAMELSPYSSNITSNVSNPDVHIITGIFTLAASIYLYLVVHGYQLETQELLSLVAEAMAVLQTKMPAYLIQAIICPLFIIGCAVNGKEKDFFRQVFISVAVLGSSLEHRGKILPTLEEVWRMRDATTGWTWQDTIKLLGQNLLLI
ncbi:Pestheic acid cluster transcriptional regulator 3 [Hyphodiscus hymeniophilus]|uniref:Pestheic acid cluster transcriptional regulator 3 n=1 Tax=Hyphodiscus hymeniophilus TaxID=353542 RepID=A0A9P6SNV0_9HELO|nr:Pestheic acid cluster transcriptional regulator 3 [Hyphodiscus hymeniophilus]